MSGLAVLCSRSGGPVDLARFERVVAALRHRAVDGSGRWLAEDGSVALWHGQFCTAPQDLGERQPLCIDRAVLAVDGRIDNREPLSSALGIGPSEAAALTDAALVLRAYRRWGEAFLDRLQGSFAVILWDGANRRLLVARDVLGRRALFYRIDGDAIIIASEPGAVLGGDAAGVGLDDCFLAHLFALRPAPLGRTLYQEVHELPAGHSLSLVDGVMRLASHAPRALSPLSYRRQEEYGEQFAELLDRAVRRRLRALGSPAVLMSGGLDSTSVAALAAKALGVEEPGRRLRVISYVFDELSDIDERQWMASMVAEHHLDQVLVVADDAGPLSDFDRWVWRANGPDTGPFRPLNERLYAAARDKGHRVLLTGSASDSLFVNGRASWLADLFEDGRRIEASIELLRHLRRQGPRAVLASDSVRRLAARLLGRVPGEPAPPPWLTAMAAEKLGSEGLPGFLPETRRLRTDRVAAFASLNQSDGIVSGGDEHRAQVELRDPFADIDLVLFMLSVPAYTLYNQGTSKFLLRMAMAHALPASLLARPTRSDISLLYWHGWKQHGFSRATDLLERTRSVWGRYVKPEALPAPGEPRKPGQAPGLACWHCLSFAWWTAQSMGTPGHGG